MPGISTHHVEETSDLTLDDLPDYNARQVRDGISANSLDDARGIVSRLERLVLCPEPATPTPSPSPSAESPARAPTPGQQRSRPPTPERQPPAPARSPSPSTARPLCTEAP